MKATRRILLATPLLASLVGLAGTLPVPAQTPEQFYKGKTIRIMLGHPPGGSYDLYARLAADFMGKYIPGHPNIIVEHKPGGGGVVATAFFYAQSPKDGTVMGLFPETIAHTQLLEPEVGKWKVQEMSYVGSFASVNPAFVVRKGAAAKTPEEMRKTSIVAGCTGKNSQSYQFPAMLNALGGFKFKIVCGYKGSADSTLAMERGEVDLVSSAWNSWRAAHRGPIGTGELIPVIQGGLKRNRELANVPLMQELVEDPKARQVLEFASAGASIGRALIVPPGVPADRLAALRAAFDKVVQDPEFIASAEKRGAELDPTPGAEVDKFRDKIMGAPQDLIEAADKAMGG
ncbi:MAG TPA: tripartite tricarboxylate transporter substrate-binding protein [Beijerinckiaceae bacterium]|nr:tripartite tricarboxylate transporter substrate-binding protein [Beijerinckiaceae bacterium]